MNDTFEKLDKLEDQYKIGKLQLHELVNRAYSMGVNDGTNSVVKESDSLPCVINRFMCQVLRDGEVIETRISQDESDIDNWIFTFKEIYSKRGKQIKYQKGVLIDC